MSRLRLGSRGSALALAQAGALAAALDGDVVTVRTEDAAVGDKARFVRGVEEAILKGDVDVGVHSAKDLPADLHEGLALVGVPERADPTDAFIGAAGALDQLPEGARVGTASLRRRSQLLALRPDLRVEELRGNVDTRLARVAAGDFDGIILATAGLARLERLSEASFTFDPAEMTPAPGQGCLAVEARANDVEAAAAAGAISDRAALLELTAERAAVRALDASCDTPVGICARVSADEMSILGYAGMPDGGEFIRDHVAGDPEQPVALGEALAERMVAAGAAELLARAAREAA